ncbi:hypothetical protein CI109_106694 [Kwoniella shandongensis]|uniref:FAD-binding domain-containing protein n=1 Tax=Kwoniella shandongensis TaxID=1734106 RepID=A0AAJ8LNW5_9TREE
MTCHVLIVGGGLAGPCLALSLARRGIRSTIFEIRPHPDMQIFYDLIKAQGYTYTRMGAYTDDGEKLGDIAIGQEGGYPAVRIMRTKLHEVLLHKVKGMRNLAEIKWGVRLLKIEEDDQGVIASFEDGTTVKGDLLIGADGIHSKVRDHVLGPSSPKPIFTNTCTVNGFLPASDAVKPSPDFTFPAFMFTSSGLFMTIPIDPEGETLAWGHTGTAQERTREEWREYELSGEAVRLAKRDYEDVHAEPVRSLLDKMDASKAKVWAPYSIPELPKWHTARVCLVGDAAHALPPNGEGSAMAFEDAAIMSRLIEAKGDRSYEDLFEKFEEIRRPRIKTLQDDSGTTAALKAKVGPVGWYIKKWAFRGFFWWNGGVVKRFGKGTAYDVDQIDVQ